MALLSASAISLYERLVATTWAPLGARGLDRDDADLAELISAGFARLHGDPPTRAVAIALPAALERALSGLQEQFLDQERQLLEARAYFDALAPRFARAQRAAQTGLHLMGSFVELLANATAAARNDIIGCNIVLPPTGIAVARVHLVCDIAFLRRRGGLRLLRAARAAGHELRIAPELPTSIAVVDASTVIVDLDGPPATDTVAAGRGVAVDSALVAGALHELFEMMWQRAVPWADPGDSNEVLTPIEHRVAALMAVGRTDDEIAAHLSMSVRTVRRHVAAVMERLHAGTRFAAGVAAVRSGLLDEGDSMS